MKRSYERNSPNFSKNESFINDYAESYVSRMSPPSVKRISQLRPMVMYPGGPGRGTIFSRFEEPSSLTNQYLRDSPQDSMVSRQSRLSRQPSPQYSSPSYSKSSLLSYPSSSSSQSSRYSLGQSSRESSRKSSRESSRESSPSSYNNTFPSMRDQDTSYSSYPSSPSHFDFLMK